MILRQAVLQRPCQSIFLEGRYCELHPHNAVLLHEPEPLNGKEYERVSVSYLSRTGVSQHETMGAQIGKVRGSSLCIE